MNRLAPVCLTGQVVLGGVAAQAQQVRLAMACYRQ